ncbi:hypothetical protein Scep_027305 [Stephania cephalantha]|uniref:Uncharacterized protein n=1 Tax=Stephania cephalantha TaxID=152367 RepID=A0AAP0EF97_9MAGN
MKFIQLSSSMPIDENMTLKKNLKLKVKLPQPKSQVENITIKNKLKLKCLLVMLLENHHSLNMKRTPMKFIQISSMPIDENITLKKNLKLKVKLLQPKSQVENITVQKKLKVKPPRARSQLDKSIEFEHERPISGSCKNGSLVKCTGKRGAEIRLCGQKLKKLKIGSGVMQQCGALLRKR